MQVIKITPRGYCHGVVTALQIVAQSIENNELKKPLFLLGEIVHNQNVTKAFKQAGVVTLTGENRRAILDTVTRGTIIVSAHGIAPDLIIEAKNKGLDIVDATCSDVYKTHDIIKEKITKGYDVLYIGKKNHPEPEGAIGINSQRIHLITNEEDINTLTLTNQKLCITNQTTMSMIDTKDLMNHAIAVFPQIEIINEICPATQQRQEAIINLTQKADLVIVVGDVKSNNTKRLVQLSNSYIKTKTVRINSLSDLNIEDLLDQKVETVAITSGASTPTIMTTEIIKFIEQFDKEDQSTWDNNSTVDIQRIIPRVKRKTN